MDNDFSDFKSEIVDKGDKYVLEANVPGYDKEDISVYVDKNMVKCYSSNLIMFFILIYVYVENHRDNCYN